MIDLVLVLTSFCAGLGFGALLGAQSERRRNKLVANPHSTASRRPAAPSPTWWS